MKYSWLDAYLLSKTGAEKDFKEEWGWDRYMIHGKLFAAICQDKDNHPILTLKLEPSVGDFMRNQYEEIVPGYYMNKEHWNSALLEGNLPDQILKDMIDQSHQLILNSLPKKIQKEIKEGSND